MRTIVPVLLLVAGCSGQEPAAEESGSVGQPLSPTSALFAVIGDYGSAGSAENDVSTLVHGWTPDFILTTGDNNYPAGEAATIDSNIGRYYQDFIFPYLGIYGPGSPPALGNRFWPSLGNHDWDSVMSPPPQPYTDYFTLPVIPTAAERYYNVVQGPVHLFAVDSDPAEPNGNTAGSTQGAWLQAALRASRSRWNIVYFHHPPFTSSRDMLPACDGNDPEPALDWPFKTWGASAVLTGHNHNYERIMKSNLPYFVNGLGGVTSKYAFCPGQIDPDSKVRFNADFGAMRVRTRPETRYALTFDFVTRTGEIIDHHNICGYDKVIIANGGFGDGGVIVAGGDGGVIIGDGFSGDAVIAKAAPGGNFGASASLVASGGSGASNVLMRWDMTELPPGTKITSAGIKLEITAAAAGGSAWEIYEVKRDWVPGEVTWMRYAAGQAWAQPGAADTTLDRGGVSLGTLQPTTTGTLALELNAAGVAMVQSWVDNPASNRGVMIVGSHDDSFAFDSSEAAPMGRPPWPPVIYIGCLQYQAPLVTAPSVWKYRADGVDLGTAWRAPGYDDSTWMSGASQLGFGDGDEATVLPAGRITYYFRHKFMLPVDPSTYKELLLRLVRDDGAVVYLNDFEVFRANMPGPPAMILYSTLAPIAMGGDATFTANENMFYQAPIDLSRLMMGENTLAVEVHQQDPASSDISFNLELFGVR